MYVTGSGGGGYIGTDSEGYTSGYIEPVSINTEYVTDTKAVINDPKRGKVTYQSESDFPLRRGDQVTILSATDEEGRQSRRCLIINHTRDLWRYSWECAQFIRPTTSEYIIVAAALLGSLVLALIAASSTNDPGDLVIALGAGLSPGALLAAITASRVSVQKRRFRSHCKKLANSIM